jgi:hypothetical protein
MEYQADVRSGGGKLSQIARFCAPVSALLGGSALVGTKNADPPKSPTRRRPKTRQI